MNNIYGFLDLFFPPLFWRVGGAAGGGGGGGGEGGSEASESSLLLSSEVSSVVFFFLEFFARSARPPSRSEAYDKDRENRGSRIQSTASAALLNLRPIASISTEINKVSCN